jgi:hypothetical protein
VAVDRSGQAQLVFSEIPETPPGELATIDLEYPGKLNQG